MYRIFFGPYLSVSQPPMQDQDHDRNGKDRQQVAGLPGRVGNLDHILQIILGKGLHAVNTDQEQQPFDDQPPVSPDCR
jgi:hypothetical protein